VAGGYPIDHFTCLKIHAMTMPKIDSSQTFPDANDDDDAWNAHADHCRDFIKGDLECWLAERFKHSSRYIRQNLGGLGNTLCIRTNQYDLYLRLFPASHNGWPRNNLTIARIGFKKKRTGHGRSLVQALVKLAPVYGYRTIYIEQANDESSAFAQRLGFTPDAERRNWRGDVETLRQTAFR